MERTEEVAAALRRLARNALDAASALDGLGRPRGYGSFARNRPLTAEMTMLIERLDGLADAFLAATLEGAPGVTPRGSTPVGTHPISGMLTLQFPATWFPDELR